MSARISLASWGSDTDVCSLSRAGMLFWPTYRVVSLLSGSGAGQEPKLLAQHSRYAPYALMASRASLLRLLLGSGSGSGSSGDRGLFLPGAALAISEAAEMLLLVAARFGLYEQS
jgi:hypothetical protein